LTLLRLVPSFESFDGLSAEEQSWVIAREYGICNGWRANFVIDQGGASFGISGDSSDVTNQVDRLLLGKLRSLSDVIVTSGKTARVERYKSSKYAPIAIFTRTGDLDSVPAVQGTQYFTPLVLAPAAVLDKVEAELSDVDARFIGFGGIEQTRAWPLEIVEVLRHEGFQSPILESGTSTIREFLDAHALDEFCLTVTAVKNEGLSARQLSASYLTSLLGEFEGFVLAQLFVTNHTSFSRWVRNGVAAQS
jgi:riboflavin biosynthesis pyrimidine reductase